MMVESSLRNGYNDEDPFLDGAAMYWRKTKRTKRVWSTQGLKKLAFRWMISLVVFAAFVIGITFIVKKITNKHIPEPLRDKYTVALHEALVFFNAQKSGRLPKENNISWRGDSGLQDGFPFAELVGGYYDGGGNAKFHFPMAYSMTLLSWTVIEYSHKYKTTGEYNHIRELIKWGTDYLLSTIDSSASISSVCSQVGGSMHGSHENDANCWQRPEDMDYPKPLYFTSHGPDLAGEMAAALAAASIVFEDDARYSRKLLDGATQFYGFATDETKARRYCHKLFDIEKYYNSSGFADEILWSSLWLYFASGNASYLARATEPSLATKAKAHTRSPYLRVLSWDNKLPAVELLMTRVRIFIDPGFPYEEMLSNYHKSTDLNMCSYLQQFKFFNRTRGGLILLNFGHPQPLQYVVNTAFIASLYADYMDANDAPGWYCGPDFFSSDLLRDFSRSQVNYILGDNPMNMSYVVGYGDKFPRYVYHRGASIQRSKKESQHDDRYTCHGGWEWFYGKKPNPHNITGALVGGSVSDNYEDRRTNFTQPTLAGNAGLSAALISLVSTGKVGIDKNTIFMHIRTP